MVKAKPKFAVMKKMIKMSDNRVKKKGKVGKTKELVKKEDKINEAPQYSSALFFHYNTQLGPPFRILLDTNFINFSIKYRVDLITGFMDCLYAKCIPYLTDCVRGELEKLGEKYRLALKIVKDYRIQPLRCIHKGIYADDCLVQRVTENKCYIVATCDKNLKRRLRKIPGVPIMSVGRGRYHVEAMPDSLK